MKQFRKHALIVLMAATISTGIYSCKKYEEGPGLSLRSRAERVAGTWGVENIKQNGNDVTSFYSGYKETYTKGGDYSYNWEGLSGTGKWEFQKDDEEIRITSTSAGQDDVVMVILKLKEDQFWYYWMDGSDKYEFHMVPR